MHYEKEIRLDEKVILIARYSEDGPVWLVLTDDKSIFTGSFHFRDAARLGWALLDAATAKSEPYSVKAGE